MGNTERNAAVDLIPADPVQATPLSLPSNVREYNFYQLVELLQKMADLNPESEEWERECRLVFSANPSLGFSPCDVMALEAREDERWVLLTNFFGLSGAQSPLPGFIVEQLVTEEPGGFKQPFMDFFNNRLINLVYANIAITYVFSQVHRMLSPRSCLLWLGLVIPIYAVKHRLTGARCWPTQALWRDVAVHRRWWPEL